MSKEHLSEFFNDTVKNADDAVAFESYSLYFENKMRSLHKELLEEAEKPVRLKGNDVLVQGKKVGTINHDHEKEDAKIEYTCDTSGKKTSHDKLANLFAALAKEHKLEESDLANAGSKALASKSEKEFKSFKNDDDLKLEKQKSHEDKADHDDSGKAKSAAEKRKNEAKKQAETAEKSYRKIDWKV